jgi:mono/diheme cytochrome c family protein
MLKSLLIFSTLGLGFSGSVQEGQTPSKAATTASGTIPAEAVRQVNPVKSTPESIAQGKKWYGYDCAMCHGKQGDGKGEVVATMKLKMSDLTIGETLKNKTDGELFYIIKYGRGEMPPEGERLKAAELWNLVNYIRSIGQKKAPAEEKAPN